MYLSLAAIFVAVQIPSFLYHEKPSYFPGDERIYSRFFSEFSNIFIDLKNIIPSISNQEHILWLPTTIWLAAVLALAILFVQRRKREKVQKDLVKPTIHLILVSVFILFSLIYVFFDVQLEDRIHYKGKNYELVFQDKRNYGKELEGFWTLGKNRTAVVVVSAVPVKELKLNISSLVKGKTKVRVGNFRATVNRRDIVDLGNTLTVSSPRGFPWKKNHLYFIKLKENNGFYPFRLNRKMKDNRFLGVFVKIDTEPY